MTQAIVSLEDIDASYGQARILFGVSMHINPSEVVSLMGRNGMGKTTTIRAMFGLIGCSSGRILVEGCDVTGQAPHRIARIGLGLVPEGRQIFPRLTVEENLVATAAQRHAGAWTLRRVYGLFPRLEERRRNLGNHLSGGEQQMLAIGRALMTNPRLLVLDEATEGLAPIIRQEIWAALAALKAEGLSILVVDKNLDALLRVADRHVVIERGHVVWSGVSAELACDRSLAERFLDVG